MDAISQDCPTLVHEAATTRQVLMFVLALSFLVSIALFLHLFEQIEDDVPFESTQVGWFFLVLWIPIALESLIGYWRRGKYSWKASSRLLLLCLIPPYRLVLSTHPGGQCLWFPFLGWQTPDRHLFARLERAFSVPMLFIALLILPILAIELFGSKYIHLYPEVKLFLDFGTSLIWLAFTLEFIVMSSVAEGKLAFIVKNWLNLLIILLPLFAFLRGFQVARLLRIGRTARVLRVYQLRGLGMRAWRGIIALELIERILHRDPQTRLEHLNAQVRDKEQDLALLRARVRQLEAQIASQRVSERDSPDDLSQRF